MRITVKTGFGNKPAPDLTDNLLSSTESLLARGKTEVFSAADAYQHTILYPFQSMINTGEIGQVKDFKYGESFVGKVSGVSIEIDENGIDMKFDLERPA